MKELRARVKAALGDKLAEQHICGENNLAVDFYVCDEATIIEVALSLRNSNSEFERDIFKALIARDKGHPVKRLVFISKPGAKKRHCSPSSEAIVEWVKRHCGIEIEMYELVDTADTTK